MTYTVPAGRYGDYSTAFIQAYIDQAIEDVVGLAPATLDTLQELSAALGDDPAFFATVAAQVAELNTDVTDVVAALGVAENDSEMGTFTSPVLPDGVTLKAVLEAFASAYSLTKTNLEAADSALSGRIDSLEADPTTAAAVAAVQADVDQNEIDGDAADSALSGRLDVLEADATTQTLVDAGDAATLVSANAYTDTSVSNLIDAAPGVLDTLNELAAAIGDDANFVTTVNASIAAVQADVDQNEIDSDAAESALSGRLDVLESDPTTATAVAAVQADVDQNEIDSDAADSALSGRLDVLEADPTTATAVAAVQADVDQNEIDSDAADAALSGRLDTLEADPTTQTAVDAKLNIANPAATGDLTVDTEARLEFDSNITKLHNDLRGTRLDIGNNITVYPAAAGGRFEIEGGLYIRLSDLEEHNNDIDAAAAGIVVGGVYYDSNGHLRIRVS
mgnify:CR=1 FL=1